MNFAIRKNISKRRLIVVVFLILTIVPGTILFNRIIFKNDKADNYIALVNGLPISTKEFDNAIEINKSKVSDYFYKKYGAEQTKEFWMTSFEGEIPLESVMKKALEDTVKLKIRQLIAKELGLLSDISYKGFIEQLDEENNRRQRAIRNHEIIYGPRQYEEKAYFEYVLSNTTRLVKNQLMKDAWKPDDQNLKRFYDLQKNQLYTSQGSVKVKLLSISFLDSNQTVDEELKKDAMKKMGNALAMAVSGIDFDDIAKSFDEDLLMMEKVFNSSNIRSNSRSPVALAAEGLMFDQISDIIEENGRFYLIKCIENQKEGSGFLDFDSNKGQVLEDYANYKYEELVKKRVSEAQIELIDSDYRDYQKMKKEAFMQ